jgi:hypothetical protein
MHTNQSLTSFTPDSLSTWLSNGIQHSIATKLKAAALFLNIGATGCTKADPLIKKG